MCESLRSGGFNRREFSKTCLLGLGGCLLTSEWLSTLTASTGISPSLWADAGPGKWSKEALFYTRTANGIQCLKCPHYCRLGVNEMGICRNRVVYQGKLYTIAYGNPCAVHIDPVEKKPLYHFLPATSAFSIAVAGCNFRCLNCQNWQISQVSPKETSNVDLMPSGVVDQCEQTRCASIAYTYSEPVTFYEYVLDTAQLARRRRIRNIFKSAGYINEEPLRRLSSYLDAANIDLKGFDDDIYQRLSGGRLAPVLKTLQVLKEQGVWLEITNLVVPSWSDNLDTIKRMSEWLVANGLSDCPLHFTRFMPLYKLTQLPLTPVPTLERAHDIALASGMRYVYVGNVPGHPFESTYCHKCKKCIIERHGFTIAKQDIAGGRCKFCGERIPGVWA
jgi:pyruvate formate lyase activating enzyme